MDAEVAAPAAAAPAENGNGADHHEEAPAAAAAEPGKPSFSPSISFRFLCNFWPTKRSLSYMGVYIYTQYGLQGSRFLEIKISSVPKSYGNIAN